ncbi:MAG: PD-(D/E)XK nuclease family protein [Vicinamibacteraceae bacterium]
MSVIDPGPAPITARRTRLVRVPDLARLQQAIALTSVGASPFQARRTAVIVPSTAAVDVLRHTLEDLCLVARWLPSEADCAALGAQDWPVRGADAAPLAIALPNIVTRAGLYRLGGEGLGAVPRIDPIAREVLAGAVARDVAAAGPAPPFTLRPALIAAMLELYDAIHRNRRTVDDFERLVGTALESGASYDRGAARLLEETRFLAAAFRAYGVALEAAGLVDEHGLRARLLAADAVAWPLTSVVVAVPDLAAAAEGLWPADYDLLTRVAGLESLTVVATEALLGTGYLTRLLDTLPDVELVAFAGDPPPAPTLVTAGVERDRIVLASRDREEEVDAFARRVRAAAAPAPADGAIALVHQRPLPYLYLARQVLGAHDVSWQAVDALPLAAEPWAAAVDVVLTFAASDASRAAGVALLSTPLLSFAADTTDEDGAGPMRPLTRDAVAAADRELADAMFVGGRERLIDLAARWRGEIAHGRGRSRRHRALTAVEALLRAADALAPLAEPRPASAQLETLATVLTGAERPPIAGIARERHLRARGAIRGLLQRAREAYLRFGDPPMAVDELAPLLRRLMEAQTFSPRIGPGLVHVVDAPAAAFGRFADVTLAGLVEGEWPTASGRNVFLPVSLLKDLGWPSDADRRTAARAMFDDLLHLPRRSLALSAFILEDDGIVRPSAYLEDLDALTFATAPAAMGTAAPFALAVAPLPGDAVGHAGRPARWPLAATPAGPLDVGPRAPIAYAVTALDRYRSCPFKYFARDVLSLEEEVADESGLSARARGTLVHAVFQTFFDEWTAAGHGAIDTAALPDARTLFATVVDRLLETIPPSERAIERAVLLGSAVAAGLGERAFRFEAARAQPLVARELEVRLDGEYALGPEARPIRLRGTADRIDLLGDGTLRLIDYKTGKASNARELLQVKIYGAIAEAHLRGHLGRNWTVADAGYLAFGRGDDLFAAVVTPETRTEVLAEAGADAIAVADAVEGGVFPVAPDDLFTCNFCGFAAVCRKDYVGDE